MHARHSTLYFPNFQPVFTANLWRSDSLHFINEEINCRTVKVMGNDKSRASLTFSTFETPVPATFIPMWYPGQGRNNSLTLTLLVLLKPWRVWLWFPNSAKRWHHLGIFEWHLETFCFHWYWVRPEFGTIQICTQILESLNYGMLWKPTWKISELGLGKRLRYWDNRIIFVAIISWSFDIGMGKHLILPFLALKWFLFWKDNSLHILLCTYLCLSNW